MERERVSLCDDKKVNLKFRFINSVCSIVFVVVEHELRSDVIGRIPATNGRPSANRVIDHFGVG